MVYFYIYWWIYTLCYFCYSRFYYIRTIQLCKSDFKRIRTWQ